MIYVLHMKDTNFYKIGHTNQKLEKRIIGIQNGCPRKLMTVLTFNGNTRLEHAIHEHLSEYTTDGGSEWFELPKDYPLDHLKSLKPLPRSKDNDTSRLTVEIDDDVYARFKKCCKEHNIKISDLVRSLIYEYLE